MRSLWPAVTVFAIACGSSPPPAPSPGGGSEVADTITGRERIGWMQQAQGTSDVARFRFAAYVDGVRSEVAAVTCSNVRETEGFACSGALPPMGAGLHTIELASVVVNGEATLESGRSAPLRVQLIASTASTASTAADWAGGETFATREGLVLRADKLAEGLRAPVDAAFAGANLFLAERGAIRVFADGRLQPTDALRVDLTEDAESARILSIAVDPDYARTHFVFVVQTAMTGGGAVYQLARYRELRGKLAERAVIFETGAPAASGASAALRFGPDRRLYLALGDTDAGGRLVRLNGDGTMPRDQPGTVPAIAAGVERVRGLAWDPSGELLWIADEGSDDAHLSALAFSPAPVRAAVRGRRAVAGGVGTLEFYGGDALTDLHGDALLASAAGAILRIRFAADDPTRLEFIDRMFERPGHAVRVVAVSPEGMIYFCTDAALGRLTSVR